MESQSILFCFSPMCILVLTMMNELKVVTVCRFKVVQESEPFVLVSFGNALMGIIWFMLFSLSCMSSGSNIIVVEISTGN